MPFYLELLLQTMSLSFPNLSSTSRDWWLTFNAQGRCRDSLPISMGIQRYVSRTMDVQLHLGCLPRLVRYCCASCIPSMLTLNRYDAGDQGKYVVNGGISTAQLLMAYERALYAKNSSHATLEDGLLRIPERANGYPDFLDEARWEMAFMLKMQVPQNSASQLVNGSYIGKSRQRTKRSSTGCLNRSLQSCIDSGDRCLWHGTSQGARQPVDEAPYVTQHRC